MLFMILFCLVLSTVIYIYTLLNGIYKHWEKKGVPFVKPVYVFGNFKDIILRKRTIFDIIMQIYQSNQNSRYIGFYQFLTPTLLIRDPELIRQLTIKDFDSFPDHNLYTAGDVDPFWTNFLVVKSVKNGWSEARTKVMHAFTSQKQRMMIPLMQECTKNLINYLKSKNGTVTLEMKELFTKVSTDIISSSTLGVSVNSLENEDNPFCIFGKKLTNFSGIRSLIFMGYANFPNLMKLLQFRIFTKETTNFFEHVIKDTLRFRKENNVYRQDLLQTLIEENFGLNGKLQLSCREITAHCLSFYFAGTESISSILSFSAYELALNRDVQNKVYDEITSTLQNSNGNLTYETISEMEYLDMVTLELFRLHTPNFAFDRKCVKPYTIEAKLPGETALHIEKGSVIWIPLREIHKDPKYFPNPEKFYPERFSKENKNRMVPNSFLPFGSGPRKCVAEKYVRLNMKVLLIGILKHFELVRVEKTEVTLTYRSDTFFLVPTHGLWIGFKPRN